ncbi:MAG: DUF6350 family protein [Actinomycetes bacterium]
MPARIFLHSLQQALRSVALLLFPAAFVSLFAWATAGSSSGNTTDPIRAASWIWLAAHNIPFTVVTHQAGSTASIIGALSFLPIGALIFPFLSTRSGYVRLTQEGSNHRGARIFFVVNYTLLTMGISFLSKSNSVASNWKWAPLFGAAVALLGSSNFSQPKIAFLKFATYLFAILWGAGLIIVGLSLATHLHIIKDLTTVIQPGWVGGAIFIAIQILYLPNAAIMALSYLFGLGFSIGHATSISPTHFVLHEIPAIPLLGGLPTEVHPGARYGLIAEIIFGLILLAYIFRGHETFAERQRFALVTIFGFLAMFASVTFLSSGELVTSALSPVGVIWWKMCAEMATVLVASMILVIYLPALIGKVRKT